MVNVALLASYSTGNIAQESTCPHAAEELLEKDACGGHVG